MLLEDRGGRGAWIASQGTLSFWQRIFGASTNVWTLKFRVPELAEEVTQDSVNQQKV